ncbi:MAG: hypothetical protein ACQKBY_05155, partial [Verrucomicrobiales bacterium]
KERARRDEAPSFGVGDFVNRRIGAASEVLTLAGVIEQAIENVGINSGTSFASADSNTVTGSETLAPDALNGLAEPEARVGETAWGSPSFVSQKDILAPLGGILTARGDTFRVRAYGEAEEANGRTIRVWCEAVVQRVPEYLDASESAELEPDDLNPVNQAFGRRFVIQSFRWLSPEEV